MTAKTEKYTVRIISIVAGLIVIATFIINGAEKDDAWLYLIAILSILSIPILTYLQKSKE